MHLLRLRLLPPRVRLQRRQQLCGPLPGVSPARGHGGQGHGKVRWQGRQLRAPQWCPLRPPPCLYQLQHQPRLARLSVQGDDGGRSAVALLRTLLLQVLPPHSPVPLPLALRGRTRC